MVQQEFEKIFPGEVACIRVVYITTTLDRLVSDLHSTQQKLEDLLDLYLTRRRYGHEIKSRITVKVVGSSYGEWGVDRYGTSSRQVDALQFYSARLEELLSQIEEEQGSILPPNSEHVVPAAFITFRSRRAQVIASTTMLHHDQSAWRVHAAPEPREIIWANLGWRKWERNLRAFLGWTIFFVTVAFYIPIIAAIQSLLQVEYLVSMPLLNKILHLPLVETFVTGLLPSIVLRVFMRWLPWLLERLAKMEGVFSNSQLQFEAFTKLFAFQVLTVFFTSLMAGSFLNQLQQFIVNPTHIIRTLGAAAPQTATFFMNYLLLLALSSKPIAFLRLAKLVKYWWRVLWAKGERAKLRVWNAQFMDYAYNTPDVTVAILIGLVFCVIAPLITPIAFIFFVIASELVKYQLLYQFAIKFESGGRIWARVSDQILFALLLFQIIMIGLLAVKGSLVQTLLLLPLPVINICHWVSTNALFRRPQQILSLLTATDLDVREKGHGGVEGNDSIVSADDLYRQPAFKVDEPRVDKLIKTAHRMDMLLADQLNPSITEMEAQMEDWDLDDGEEEGQKVLERAPGDGGHGSRPTDPLLPIAGRHT